MVARFQPDCVRPREASQVRRSAQQCVSDYEQRRRGRRALARRPRCTRRRSSPAGKEGHGDRHGTNGVGDPLRASAGRPQRRGDRDSHGGPPNGRPPHRRRSLRVLRARRAVQGSGGGIHGRRPGRAAGAGRDRPRTDRRRCGGRGRRQAPRPRVVARCVWGAPGPAVRGVVQRDRRAARPPRLASGPRSPWHHRSDQGPDRPVAGRELRSPARGRTANQPLPRVLPGDRHRQRLRPTDRGARRVRRQRTGRGPGGRRPRRRAPAVRAGRLPARRCRPDA